MKQTIDQLKRLHIFDRHVALMERDLRDLPKRLEEIEAGFADQRKRIGGLERRRSRIEESRKQKEAFLADENAHLESLKKKQPNLTTEREVNALERELEASQKIISNVEDEVLRFGEEIEELSGKIAEIEKEIEAGRSEFSDEIADIEERMEQARKEIEARAGQRKELTADIESRLLKRYELIRNTHAYALAMIEGDLCRACNMHVPPQIGNLVAKGEGMHTCPYCNRILVIPDDDLEEAEREVERQTMAAAGSGTAVAGDAAEETAEEAEKKAAEG